MNMDSEYWEAIKKIAAMDNDIISRGHDVVRDMAKVIEAIMEYEYTLKHYRGKSDNVEQDAKNKVVKAMIPMINNTDIFAEEMGVVFIVNAKAKERVRRILIRIMGS